MHAIHIFDKGTVRALEIILNSVGKIWRDNNIRLNIDAKFYESLHYNKSDFKIKEQIFIKIANFASL